MALRSCNDLIMLLVPRSVAARPSGARVDCAYPNCSGMRTRRSASALPSSVGVKDTARASGGSRCCSTRRLVVKVLTASLIVGGEEAGASQVVQPPRARCRRAV